MMQDSMNRMGLGLVLMIALSGCMSSKAPDGPALDRVAEWDAQPSLLQNP
jgi:hypothetical protein